jgi:hypothetical protein
MSPTSTQDRRWVKEALKNSFPRGTDLGQRNLTHFSGNLLLNACLSHWCQRSWMEHCTNGSGLFGIATNSPSSLKKLSPKGDFARESFESLYQWTRSSVTRAQHLLSHPGEWPNWGISQGMPALDSTHESTRGQLGLLARRAQRHCSVSTQTSEMKVYGWGCSHYQYLYCHFSLTVVKYT